MSNILTTSGSKGGKSATTGTYIVLALSLGAMTFFGVCSPRQQQTELGGRAGSVGSEEITHGEFARAYERTSAQLKQQYGEEYNAKALRVANKVLDDLLEERILYLKAQELGLTATDNEVVAYLTSQSAFTDKDGKFSAEVFRNFLRGNGYTEKAFQEDLRRGLTLQKLRQLITTTSFVSNKAVELDYRIQESKVNVEYVKIDTEDMKLDISNEEISAFLAKEGAQDRIKGWYDSHKSDFSAPEQVKARHILISFQGSKSASADAEKRSKEDAHKRAAEALEKVKKSPAAFADIAKEYTDEPGGKERGGDLGFFTRDAMVKEFADAAFSLPAGNVSGIVESPFGFHIIKVEAKQPAKETSLAEATNDIVHSLIKQEKGPQLVEARAKQVYETLAKKEAADGLLKQFGAEWKKTGDFALGSRYIPGLGTKPEVMEAVVGLNPEHPLVDKPIKVGTGYVIARLADYKQADLAKLDAEKRKQISHTTAFMEGYGAFTTFVADAKHEYEKGKSIYKNPSYLALDNEGSDKE